VTPLGSHSRELDVTLKAADQVVLEGLTSGSEVVTLWVPKGVVRPHA